MVLSAGIEMVPKGRATGRITALPLTHSVWSSGFPLSEHIVTLRTRGYPCLRTFLSRVLVVEDLGPQVCAHGHHSFFLSLLSDLAANSGTRAETFRSILAGHQPV